MICARECPSWCIDITSHTAPATDVPAGARTRTVNVLDAFTLDWSLCMFCGICVDECPFDALAWSADAVPAGDRVDLLRHGIERLADPAVTD
nr:4Fe-4S binding protein [Microlunatus kandeliicorticis]